MPMAGFELRTSGVRSNHSANCTSTTVQYHLHTLNGDKVGSTNMTICLLISRKRSKNKSTCPFRFFTICMEEIKNVGKAISQIWSIVDFNFSSGWLSSITSMVGNMFVSGDEVNLRVEQVRKPRFYLALKYSDPIHCIYLSIWILK